MLSVAIWGGHEGNEGMPIEQLFAKPKFNEQLNGTLYNSTQCIKLRFNEVITPDMGASVSGIVFY